MSTFSVDFEIGDLQGRYFETLQGLVDTGATFTVVPGNLLERLGVRPQRKEPFALADGRLVEYEVGTVLFRLAGKEGASTCVFAPAGIEPLIGAVTLETLLLGVDPVNERLISVTGKLKLL